jgi:hypothetical protein
VRGGSGAVGSPLPPSRHLHRVGDAPLLGKRVAGGLTDHPPPVLRGHPTRLGRRGQTLPMPAVAPQLTLIVAVTSCIALGPSRRRNILDLSL